MSRLISFVLTESNCEQREESENYEMKTSYPQWDLEPTFSRLLDWRSNLLCYQVRSDCIDIYRQMIFTYPTMYSNNFNKKTRNKINLKFHFIIYRDSNVTVLSKRFPTINTYIDNVQHVAKCMLSRITSCSR